MSFTIGDVIVDTRCEGMADPDRLGIHDVIEGFYTVTGGNGMSSMEVDSNYINENEVLWYFEEYDPMINEWKLLPTRSTIVEMEAKYKGKTEVSPVYSLGFRLPKSSK